MEKKFQILKIVAVSTCILLPFIFILKHHLRTDTLNREQLQILPSIKENCLKMPTAITDWKSFNTDSLSTEQIFDYFHFTNSTACRLAHNFGGIVMNRDVINKLVGKYQIDVISNLLGFVPGGIDGQYSICLDPPAVAPRLDDCLVYTFGINNEWSFEDAMALYGCEVYAFDPSMNQSNFDRGDNIHYYNFALSSTDAGPLNRSISTLFNQFMGNHGDTLIDYLKIDIEGNEWPVIPQIIQSGMLKKVRQLVIEVHFIPSPGEDINTYRRYVSILKSLEDAGMIRFDSKYNPWCLSVIKALNHTGHFCFQMNWYNSIHL